MYFTYLREIEKDLICSSSWYLTVGKIKIIIKAPIKEKSFWSKFEYKNTNNGNTEK